MRHSYCASLLQGLLGLARNIDLSQNGFTGTLPTELGNLRGSAVLSLFDNQLSGPIPSELGLLDSNTEALDLIRPREYEGIRNVTKILLYDNELTGTVPSSLGMLGMLKALEIYNNSGLSGTIPASLCGLGSLSEVGGIKLDCELNNCTCDACSCM